jgi:hypothetical protein
VMRHVRHPQRSRVTHAEPLDPLQQIRCPVADDLSRRACPRHGLLEFRIDEDLVRFGHRHQGDQVQVARPQGAHAERHRVERHADDDEELLRADLEGVIDEPGPAMPVRQSSGEAGVPQAKDPGADGGGARRGAGEEPAVTSGLGEEGEGGGGTPEREGGVEDQPDGEEDRGRVVLAAARTIDGGIYFWGAASNWAWSWSRCRQAWSCWSWSRSSRSWSSSARER